MRKETVRMKRKSINAKSFFMVNKYINKDSRRGKVFSPDLTNAFKNRFYFEIYADISRYSVIAFFRENVSNNKSLNYKLKRVR